MEISPDALQQLRVELRPLIGVQFDVLKLPRGVLSAFEPSQIGTMVGVLMDACIPHLAAIVQNTETLSQLGIRKHPGIFGDREGYPDYLHEPTGRRLELKLLYVDPVGLIMKKPPTPREPSARLTQKVTVKNVDPANDALLVLAYQLRPNVNDPDLFSPTIISFEVFSMIECIRARDRRLSDGGGRWMGDYETPVVISQQGRKAKRMGIPLGVTYGRKANEGHHWNEDTNFGKLARIPYPPLRAFLQQAGVAVSDEQE